MQSWKQKETYEDSSQVQKVETQEPAVQVTEEEGEGGKKKKGLKFDKRSLIILAGVVVVIGIGVLTLLYKASSKAQMEHPNTEPSDFIIDPNAEDSDFLGQFTIAFQYTPDELSQLRAWGYTGPEIEENQVNQVQAADLIEASRQAQEEARASLANPESPEYQHLLNQTWLGEPSVSVPYVGPDTEYTVARRRVNCDYTKMEPHGTNLMLRVTLPNGNHHFMEVSVQQWGHLEQSGNIVVDYSEVSVNGQIFITNMVEVEV